MTKIDFERLEALLKSTGKTKTHLCNAVGRGRYYLNDIKKGCGVPDDFIAIFARELNTTPEYLTGQTDQKENPAPNKVSEMLGRYALLRPEQQKLVEMMINEMYNENKKGNGP